MSQETFEERVMAEEELQYDILRIIKKNTGYTDEVGNFLLFEVKIKDFTIELQKFVSRALKDQRESIISEIEDMQTRVRLEQFTVDEIIWLIRNK